MEAIHLSVWASLAVAVLAMIWFLGGSPLDETRWRNIFRAERVAGYGLAAGLVLLAALGISLIVWDVFFIRE